MVQGPQLRRYETVPGPTFGNYGRKAGLVAPLCEILGGWEIDIVLCATNWERESTPYADSKDGNGLDGRHMTA